MDSLGQTDGERWTGRLKREDSTRGILKGRDGDTEMVFLRSNEGEISLFLHAWYCLQSLPPHRGAEWAALCRPPIFCGKTKITVAVSGR